MALTLCFAFLVVVVFTLGAYAEFYQNCKKNKYIRECIDNELRRSTESANHDQDECRNVRYCHHKGRIHIFICDGICEHNQCAGKVNHCNCCGCGKNRLDVDIQCTEPLVTEEQRGK